MEALTHAHPSVPLLLWGPIAGFLLYVSMYENGLGIGPMLAMGALGLVVWSLTEYLVHRFIFHFPTTRRTTRYLLFLFHGIHHHAPSDKTRLVMPPTGSILIIGAMSGVYATFIPSPWIEPFLGFFIMGYIIYDYIHYVLHFHTLRGPIGGFLKRHHMMHHHRMHHANFGVSSPLWDVIFGTYHAKPSPMPLDHEGKKSS